MTADPKAPGAAAVYLEMREIDNDPLHYQNTYVRIKVLAEKGKSLATVNLPYSTYNFQITDIKGRTIHADGTVIPMTVKPEDLLVIRKDDQQIQKKVFTLPRVEVGSILEYTYTLRYDDGIVSSPTWDVQQSYFVHKAHYEFTPISTFAPGQQKDTGSFLTDAQGTPLRNLVWWGRLPQGVKVEALPTAGKYSLDVADIPAIPNEEWMPPLNAIVYKVGFYYKSASASSTADYWASETKRWSSQVNDFAAPTKAMRAIAASLVAPGDTALAKAQKLYAAVQTLENTDYTRKKSAEEMKQLKLKAAHNAQDTWKQKSGSRSDIALLYLAMLRAAKIPAYAAIVVNRDKSLFDPSYMQMRQFSDTLVVLNIDGKSLFLDPGEKMCPFKTVNWKHSGIRGLSKSAQGSSIIATPQQIYTENTTLRSGDLTVDEHGSFTGSLRFVFHGQEALRWRQSALVMDSAELKKQFDHELEEIMPVGTEAHLDHFLGLDNPDVNLAAMINVKGSTGAATARRLILPAFFFETRGHAPFVDQERRQAPVDMHYGNVTTDEVTYHLPTGMTVEGAPPEAKVSWAGHAAYVVKTKSEPGQITITHTVIRAFADAKPGEYQDLRGFYSKVAAGDQAQLILTAAANAAGAN